MSDDVEASVRVAGLEQHAEEELRGLSRLEEDALEAKVAGPIGQHFPLHPPLSSLGQASIPKCVSDKMMLHNFLTCLAVGRHCLRNNLSVYSPLQNSAKHCADLLLWCHRASF